MRSTHVGVRTAGVAAFACAICAGCIHVEIGYGPRQLSGDDPPVDEVGIVSIGGGTSGKFSTTSQLSIESFAGMNLGLTGFDPGDIFIDEFRGGVRVFPIQGPVRPFVGFGASMGLYVKTLADLTPETDAGVGVLGCAGVEFGAPDKFMISVEGSYLANSASDYGGGQLTVSLVFKQ